VQELVNKHFNDVAHSWNRLYESSYLAAVIYQKRKNATLEWVDALRLPAGAQVLDVGCGAGVLSVELAQRGFRVYALDTVEAMLNFVRKNAQRAGVSELVTPVAGDVHALGFGEGRFDLVVALGVIPWLDSPELAIRQMAHVLRANGHMIVSADNRWRLQDVLNPSTSPLLSLPRRAIGALLRWCHALPPREQAIMKLHSVREFDRMLSAAGMQKVRGTTIGFGPFRFCGISLLPKTAELRLNDRLQGHVDRGVVALSLTGTHYLICATRLGPHLVTHSERRKGVDSSDL
jgi:ubiquinone/menaquinone biosynthesis C-methylase UbiE